MTRHVKLLSGLGLALAVLAACDGSDGTFGNAQTQFGPAFAAAFNAQPVDEPKEDLAIIFRGVNGPNFTAEPIDI
ncbi:hypothetical protein E4L95_04495 [Paracoccus liaowanqingii]|jgi:hypothetical protein|uniref:Uncharacterized protein n=1 Tax=Paracoccus liaowanqingii TaxID=2560053 RepID=A0A4Z1CQX6_9RHOB|nr:hypothetical protein [Paracoccus liaowanqingii]QDA36469.1 hypothetical protein E4191_20430 [Paracoccus liaowanqingii]TGN67545.1 hypothetical protein E4L95_04495 [Paracoccus liaowanqingii]